MIKFFLPPDAQARQEIAAYVKENRNQYIGFSIRPTRLAGFTAYMVNKELGTSYDKWDVVATWRAMIERGELVKEGYYHPHTLYWIPKEEPCIV